MNSNRYEQLQAIVGPVSRETLARLDAFETFFITWARKINLTSSSTLDDLWNRHILDSAQLFPLGGRATRWLDLGSGGGFPGLILAILLKERPGGTITLVDSNKKKAAFLQNAIGQFSLPANVICRRIDSEMSDLVRPEMVTARALAPLPELLQLSFPWLSNGATGLFHKGRDYRTEIQESAHVWSFDLVEHPSRIDPRGVILEIRDVERRPTTSRHVENRIKT